MALLTMNEVAELTRTPIETLRYWRQRGEGPLGFRVGRRVLYRPEDVDAWLADQRAADPLAQRVST